MRKKNKVEYVTVPKGATIFTGPRDGVCSKLGRLKENVTGRVLRRVNGPAIHSLNILPVDSSLDLGQFWGHVQRGKRGKSGKFL